LEGTLPDVAASRIIRNVMTPAFKANNFDDGVAQGVEAIVAQLEGKTTGAGTSAQFADVESGSTKQSFEFQGPDIPWYMRILLGCFIFGIIGLFTVIGVMTPGMGWFLYVFLIPFWAMFPIIIIGPKATVGLLGVYLVGYPVAKLWLKRQPWYAKAAEEMKTKGTTTVGGMVISSGGSSSSSSGGGGFSGGGGSSGGGGASGSW
ncbi:MAG: TPM domain-containing protein, partial [Casimicrobiaceae bacterium]